MYPTGTVRRLLLSVAKITDPLEANRSSAKDSACEGFSGHLRGCTACRDVSVGSERRRRCWWISGSFLLGVVQAEIQEFMFMHKALPIFRFYCHSAPTFCSFWGEEEIGRVEIHSYNELTIVRAEQFPRVQEALVGFQSTGGSLSSADDCRARCTRQCPWTALTVVVASTALLISPHNHPSSTEKILVFLDSLTSVQTLGYSGQTLGSTQRLLRIQRPRLRSSLEGWAPWCSSFRPPEPCWASVLPAACARFLHSSPMLPVLDWHFIPQGLRRFQLGTGRLLAKAWLH